MRLLVGVVHADIHHHIEWEVERGACREVDTTNLHLANVHHHPAIHASALWHGNNLVGHIIVIGIGSHAHTTVEAVGANGLPLEAHIILVHKLRIERHVADVGIVEVVERGHTENALVEGAQEEVAFLHRLIAEKHRRGELMLPCAVARHHLACAACGGTVVDHGVEHRCLCLESLVGVGACQCHEGGVAIGIGEICKGGIEVVPLVVHREVGLPVLHNVVLIGNGDIDFVLPEFVVEIE